MLENIIELLKRYKPRKYGWTGNYQDWNLAKNKCAGYNDDIILSKIKESTLKVKNGEFAWERDGMILDRVYYSWPLLSHLMLSAARNKGDLSVIDFGGSLGTSYFQNRQYLKSLANVTWTIVEQPNYVKIGTENIAFEGLDFCETIDLAFEKHKKYDVFLINCVLPYLDDPYEFLEHLKSYSFKTIIIENTYYNYKPEDRICIQTVDPMFYDSSYPCWFLNYEKVKSIFLDSYEVFQEYNNEFVLYLDNKTVNYKSLVLNLREK